MLQEAHLQDTRIIHYGNDSDKIKTESDVHRDDRIMVQITLEIVLCNKVCKRCRMNVILNKFECRILFDWKGIRVNFTMNTDFWHRLSRNFRESCLFCVGWISRLSSTVISIVVEMCVCLSFEGVRRPSYRQKDSFLCSENSCPIHWCWLHPLFSVARWFL